MEAIEKLLPYFYSKVVEDEIPKAIFVHMSKELQMHVAHFLAELFGGGEKYRRKEPLLDGK